MSVRFRKTTIVVFILLALSLTGCLGGAKATPAVDAAAITQAAETIIAGLTQNAPTAAPATPAAAAALPEATATLEPLPPTSTLAPTETPLPTDTPIPTDTPLPTDTPTPTNTATPVATATPAYRLTFFDDFAKGYSGWFKQDSEEVHFHFPQGGYAIENRVIQDAVWSVRWDVEMMFHNVRVEVRGSRVKGSIDGYYGVVCRFADGSNYYLFGVGSDGWYGIGKQKMGVLNFLVEGVDTAAVYTGNYPNLVRADCIDDMLTLYVNGFKVAEVQDKDFSGGAVGVAVGTRKNPYYEALFDDFSIYIPE